MRLRFLFCAFVIGCFSVVASAQSQHKVVEKRLKSYFLSYEGTYGKLGTCKLVRMQLDPKKRTLIIHANANFGFQPFRPETTKKIYDDLRRVLPGPVNYYDITLLVGDKSIDELIPNRYRKEKEESNRFVMARFEEIRRRAREAEDPVYAGLQLAILGNYIDFSALQGQISFQELEQMMDQALGMKLNPVCYAAFCQELEKSKTLLYITDNAGENHLAPAIQHQLDQIFKIFSQPIPGLADRLYFFIKNCRNIRDRLFNC